MMVFVSPLGPAAAEKSSGPVHRLILIYCNLIDLAGSNKFHSLVTPAVHKV
jgi:hypothetical protein